MLAGTIRDARNSTIHESDEDPPGVKKVAKPDVIELRRMRKRDWAKKIYKSLLVGATLLIRPNIAYLVGGFFRT